MRRMCGGNKRRRKRSWGVEGVDFGAWALWQADVLWGGLEVDEEGEEARDEEEDGVEEESVGEDGYGKRMFL